MSNEELECVKDVILLNMKTQDIWFDISDGFVETLKEKDKEIERLNDIINKIKSITYNSIEYNAFTKVALIRESLQGSDKE